MVVPSHAWALEQNDRRLVFASGPEATMFAETRAFSVTRHHHPAWKVVLPLGGHAEIGLGDGPTVTGPGMIVPPQLPHTCASSSSYVAVFLDPWVLCPELGPTVLDGAAVRRILDALGHIDGAAGDGPDLAAARAELTDLTGAGRPLDTRVAHAVAECARTDPGGVGAIAAGLGISAPRLRALVRASVGVPLVQLRQWARLRAAVAELPRESVAAAAATAGFADQAHLARTARAFLGRAPSSMGHGGE